MKPDYLVQGVPPEWNEVARVFAALGDSYRQRILLAFEPGEALSIQQIAEHLPLSRTAAVHHLKTLREAGILQSEKSGRETLYRLDESRVQWALDALQTYLNAQRGEA
jgi:ArsR family transcriptional regulator, arsenate/arsenite/antimonite-responsive transcriptional repressor